MIYSLGGTDLASQKIRARGLPPDLFAAPALSRGGGVIADRYQGYRSRLLTAAIRPFRLPVAIDTTSLADKHAALDWVNGFHGRETVLRADDGVVARERFGMVTELPFAAVGTIGAGVLHGEIVLDSKNPLWRATSDTVVSSIGASPVALTLGNGKVEDWVLAITVSGGSGSRTITVTLGGTESFTLTWTGNPGGDTLTITASAFSVLLNTTPSGATWVGGFPPLLPGNSTTIAVSSSSGTATATLTYRSRYLTF